MTNAELLERLIREPYLVYGDALASGVPIRHEPEPDVTSTGVWLFARHAQAAQVLALQDQISKNVGTHRPEGMGSPYDLFVLNRDGEDHLRLRRLIAQFFSASRIRSLEHRIRALADDLAARFMAKDEIDLIRDFAEPLPLMVIADLIGVDHGDIGRIREWTIALLPVLDGLQNEGPAMQAVKRDAMRSFMAYARQIVEARRGDSDGGHGGKTDDLLAHLMAAEQLNRLSHEELLVSIAFMFFVGHETTVNLIGNGLYLLLAHPDQLLALRDRRELLGSAVEEILRFESPVQRVTFRLAAEPFAISEHQVSPGEQVNVLLGAANRDPAVFERPDEFDIARSPNPHLAFGAGLHNCLGKVLARLEGRIALERMVDVLPGLRLTGDTPRWRSVTALRGLEALPVLRA